MVPQSKSIVSLRYLQSLIGFSAKDLKRIAGVVGRFYQPFDMRKIGTDKWRHIDNPTDTLKDIQRRLQRNLLNKYKFPDTIFGAVPGGSIKKNAQIHVGQKFVVNFDLKNCFGRIDNKTIYCVYKDVFRCSSKIATLLTKLTTFQNRLPQGAPSSSILANAALLSMHDEIKNICNQYELKFSFYVDDITFSGGDALNAVEPIHKIIRKYGHAISCKKKSITPQNASQKVTGIGVNQKTSIGILKKKKIFEEIIEFSNKFEITLTEYNSLWGKINHAKMICTEQGIVLENLAEKYLPLPKDNQNIERIKIAETRPCKNHSSH